MESYDIIRLKEDILAKADKHELSQIVNNVSDLARSVGTLSTVVDGLCSRIEALENKS